MKYRFILILICFSTATVTYGQWSLSGNAGTNSFNYLGTSDGKPLVIRTNAIDRITVDTAGNVGIGTAMGTLEQRLDVFGTAQLRRKANATSLVGGYGSSALQFQSSYWNGYSASNNNWVISSVQMGSASNYADLNFSQDDGANRLTLGYNGFAFFNRNAGEVFNYDHATDTLNALTGLASTGITNTGWIKSGKMLIGTKDTTGMGTHILGVNGSAIFTKAVVKLHGNWPDFVFESKYGLLPIPALENYIKEHKHLPGVESAAEVQQNGIDLGANQAVLLQKIEELTLYIIEQQKRIQALEEGLLLLKKDLGKTK